MNLKYFTFSPQIVWKTYVVLELSLQLPHRSSELNSVVVLISCGISYELKQVSVFSFDISIFMYMFLAGLGLLVVVGLHQLLESRKCKRPIQKVEMGTSSQNNIDMSWIPQETLNQINKASPRRLPRKWAQKRSVGSDE